jgi:quinol monooxygenase YgiN
MWKLKDEAAGAGKADNLAKMTDLLHGCRAIVPGMGRFEVGHAEPGLASTCDIVLYSEFEDAAALDAYQQHADHQAILPFIRSVIEARQCVDYVL